MGNFDKLLKTNQNPKLSNACRSQWFAYFKKPTPLTEFVIAMSFLAIWNVFMLRILVMYFVWGPTHLSLSFIQEEFLGYLQDASFNYY